MKGTCHCYSVDREATDGPRPGTKEFLIPGDYAVCEVYSVPTFFASFIPHSQWNSHWRFPRPWKDTRLSVAEKEDL